MFIKELIIMFKVLSNLSKNAKQNEEGQGLVEYALILVLVAVVVIVILSQMGPAVGNIFSTVVGALNGGVASEEEGGEDCLWDTNIYYIFPSGQDTILQGSLTYYNDSDCTNATGTGDTTWSRIYRASAFSSAAANNACEAAVGASYEVQSYGEIHYCRSI
jgi:pilus assembly protein Flp/PilA